MNEGIANVASELFYNGNLKTFHNVSEQRIECNNGDIHEILNPQAPITYLDTLNMEYFEDGIGGSCENSKESLLVFQLVNMLLNEGIMPNEIGVITPYRKHKINIQNKLKDMAKDVDVDTVYRFQGREKEVIIISFCNSRLRRLGPFLRKFIERPSQVNVAITRARKKLFLVGNSKTLKESKLLMEIIKIIGKILLFVLKRFLNDLMN